MDPPSVVGDRFEIAAWWRLSRRQAPSMVSTSNQV